MGERMAQATAAVMKIRRRRLEGEMNCQNNQEIRRGVRRCIALYHAVPVPDGGHAPLAPSVSPLCAAVALLSSVHQPREYFMMDPWIFLRPWACLTEPPEFAQSARPDLTWWGLDPIVVAVRMSN